MALLTGEPRSASVIARSSVLCYRLGPEHFDEHLRSRPEIVEAISDIFARRLVELRNVRDARRSLFDALPEQEREALWAELDEVTFAPDSEIARQGAEEDWMYIIINGKAEVRVQDSDNAQSRKVATLRQGDIFGEMAVLSDQPRSATVTALTRVDCYQLKKSVLDQLLADYPKLKDSLEEILSHREAELSEAQSGLVEDRDRERIDNLRSGLARRINRFFSIGIPKDASQAGDSDSYTHRAIGRLFFAAPTSEGEEKPLHNMPIELWHHGVFDLILSHTTTARDGTFEIWYDAAQVGANANLELRVFETHHTYNKHGELSFSPRHVYTIPGDGTVETKFDFGDQYVPYWEYDPDQPIPRTLILEQGDPPQSYAPGRAIQMAKVVAGPEIIKRKHQLKNRFDKSQPSLDKIQKDYPENLTVRLERENPGCTRTDEYFGERMLNGMSASVFDRDEENPDLYRIYHHWNSYEQDGIHALPNVDMRFEVRNENLFPVKIILSMREPGATAPNSPVEKLTFTPESGDAWEQAKRIARVSAALIAELDNHLVSTHLNTEQYALPMYRNLRKNPLRYLLFPHVKEVALINRSADGFLLGPGGYVIRASALTNDSAVSRVVQVMGTLDWKNWGPIQPICENHVYAKVANLYWETLTDHVNDFFEQHEEEIVKHWYEVHLFSRELVEHSVEDFLCQYLQKSNGGQAPDWMCRDERMDLSVPRYVYDGVPKAIQPVTLSNIPAASDIENMKQVCRYVIFHSTFKHTWANSKQYDDGGEILYNCLGLRYGDNGVFVPESDHSIAPPPDQSTELLWISYMLSKAVYGYVMKNEDNDIDPAFPELLEKRRADFARLDFDIDTIQSRTNI